ncbi:hypothetical protein F4703DRAFT_1308195 [Phycomyces blakesleeanus]
MCIVSRPFFFMKKKVLWLSIKSRHISFSLLVNRLLVLALALALNRTNNNMCHYQSIVLLFTFYELAWFCFVLIYRHT